MPVTLYEHPAWQSVPGQVMRPGGLAVTERALAFCDLPPGANFLDIGCGAGATLQYLAHRFEASTFGLDVSATLLLRAKHTGSQASFTQAQSEYLPLAGESMDAIISECTLSLFKADMALRECMRVLKSGGFLIVSDLYARHEEGIAALRQLPPGTCIQTAMSREQIATKIEGCGFEITVWKDCSDQMKGSVACTLAQAAAIDSFDLFLAAARAKLGYYFLVARKVDHG